MDVVGCGVDGSSGVVVVVAGEEFEMGLLLSAVLGTRLVVGCGNVSSDWCGGELGGVKNCGSSLSDGWFSASRIGDSVGNELLTCAGL